MKLSDIKKIAVIGSGIMGHGIAQTFALGGYEVIINDISQEILDKAMGQVRKNLDTFIEFGITTDKAAKEAVAKIKTSPVLKDTVKDADLVVEALPEKMDLKKKVFKDLDSFSLAHTIIASNTSGLRITEMASDIKRKDKAVIAHWWNPPHIIPLVEIVGGKSTSEETINLVYQILVTIGKKPVRILKEVPGFLGNRLQFALYREALACLRDGVATVEDIDLAVKASFGFRLPTIGPLETSDFGGLDTFLSISDYLFKEIDASTKAPDILREKVKAGKLGVKTGEGFYSYPGNKAQEKIKERDRQFLERLKFLYVGKK